MEIVSDTLTRMKNAVMRDKETVEVKKNKLSMEVLRVLKEESFIRDIKEEDAHLSNGQGKVIVELAYFEDGEPVVENFEKVSKQGQRVYVNSKELVPVMNGRGIGVISTSKGVMTVASAKSRSLGGEYICKVW